MALSSLRAAFYKHRLLLGLLPQRVQTFKVLFLFLFIGIPDRVSEKATLEIEAFELDVTLLTVSFSHFSN